MRESIPTPSDGDEIELWDRYLAGETSPADEAVLRRTVVADGGDPERLAGVATVFQTLRGLRTPVRASATPDPIHPSSLHAAVRARLGLSVAAGISAGSVIHRPARSAKQGASIARVRRIIIAAGVMSTAAAIWYAGPLANPARKTESGNATRNAQVYATQSAQRATVTLPDGSRAILAPATTLRYAETSNGARELLLDGQAQFTVTHDPRSAFTVRTGHVVTRVLGTTFDVRRYATDDAVQVIVRDGRVQSRSLDVADAQVIVSAGEMARVTDSTATSVRADVNALTAWATGRLSFDDTPVPDMLATLGRWYGYDFRMGDTTLRSRYVTAEFNVADREKTLAALKQLLQVTLTFDGSTVTLRRASSRASGTGRAPARDSREHLPSATEMGR